MQEVTNTEYQAIQRVVGGVLLVVNKFESDKSYGEHCVISLRNTRPYNKSTQSLRVLKDDYNRSAMDYDTSQQKTYVIPKGTVVYGCFPVKLTSKENWTYIIKTTGECFGGDRKEMIKHFDNIIKILNKEVSHE